MNMNMNIKEDIMPFNDKGQPHGLWEMYYFNGPLMWKCSYHNDKKVGYEEDYYYDGKINEKTYNI